MASPLAAGSATAGWEFTPQRDIWVTQLGFYDEYSDGLGIPHTVALWDVGGNLLTSATVPAGAGATLQGGFRYVSVVHS